MGPAGGVRLPPPSFFLPRRRRRRQGGDSPCWVCRTAGACVRILAFVAYSTPTAALQDIYCHGDKAGLLSPSRRLGLWMGATQMGSVSDSDSRIRVTGTGRALSGQGSDFAPLPVVAECSVTASQGYQAWKEWPYTHRIPPGRLARR